MVVVLLAMALAIALVMLSRAINDYIRTRAFVSLDLVKLSTSEHVMRFRRLANNAAFPVTVAAAERPKSYGIYTPLEPSSHDSESGMDTYMIDRDEAALIFVSTGQLNPIMRTHARSFAIIPFVREFRAKSEVVLMLLAEVGALVMRGTVPYDDVAPFVGAIVSTISTDVGARSCASIVFTLAMWRIIILYNLEAQLMTLVRANRRYDLRRKNSGRGKHLQCPMEEKKTEPADDVDVDADADVDDAAGKKADAQVSPEEKFSAVCDVFNQGMPRRDELVALIGSIEHTIVADAEQGFTEIVAEIEDVVVRFYFLDTECAHWKRAVTSEE
jgi:hypothetical protein